MVSFDALENVLIKLMAGFQAAFITVIFGFFDAITFLIFSIAPTMFFAFVLTLFLWAYFHKYIDRGYA